MIVYHKAHREMPTEIHGAISVIPLWFFLRDFSVVKGIVGQATNNNKVINTKYLKRVPPGTTWW